MKMEDRREAFRKVREARCCQMLAALERAGGSGTHTQIARACDLAKSAYTAQLLLDLLTERCIDETQVVFPNGVQGSLYTITAHGYTWLDAHMAPQTPRAHEGVEQP
jgi:hypothetical protein